jgi:hypothetical protein
MSEVSFEAAHCPNCGDMREVSMTHHIIGDESFLHHTLASIGIPPLHIIRANNGLEYCFYELTGDLPDALNFKDFKEAVVDETIPLRDRIRIGAKVKLEDHSQHPASGRIKLHE